MFSGPLSSKRKAITFSYPEAGIPIRLRSLDGQNPRPHPVIGRYIFMAVTPDSFLVSHSRPAPRVQCSLALSLPSTGPAAARHRVWLPLSGPGHRQRPSLPATCMPLCPLEFALFSFPIFFGTSHLHSTSPILTQHSSLMLLASRDQPSPPISVGVSVYARGENYRQSSSHMQR